MKQVIGIQGGEASYHEAAAKQIHPKASIRYYGTFTDVFNALHAGKITSAVLAIANNRIQFLADVYEQLTTRPEQQHIVNEVYLRIEHVLVAPTGADLATIEAVHSQAPALGQCSHFLENSLPHVEVIEEHDTAYSAQLVAGMNDKKHAAIASHDAAKLYGLKILQEAVQDDADNITRFIELRAGKSSEAKGQEDKTSLLLHTGQAAGSLVQALQAFSNRGVNLSSIQSRIIPNSPFEMSFFLEAEVGLLSSDMVAALDELKASGYQTEILGTYKKADIPIEQRGRTL